jgi:hypothetical protein
MSAKSGSVRLHVRPEGSRPFQPDRRHAKFLAGFALRRSQDPFPGHAGRRLRSGQLCECDELRPRTAGHPAGFGAVDPGNPRTPSRRGARLAPHPRRTPDQPELDRPRRLHPERGDLRSAPAGGGARSLGATRTVYPRPFAVAPAAQSAWPMPSSRRSTRSSTGTAASAVC